MPDRKKKQGSTFGYPTGRNGHFIWQTAGNKPWIKISEFLPV